MTAQRPFSSTRPWLALIVLAYLAAAAVFAVVTPAWQAPDEPAHYNYIAHLAQGNGLPVLRMGDYDQAYLERLKDEHFPPDLPVHPVRYEFHHPPLYYLTAVPVFWLSGGNLVALRLYGVLIGVGVLLLLFACVETIFPHRPAISLGATAFAALLPMHVAMMGAVNNDGAAELLIAATLLVLLRWMRVASGEWRVASGEWRVASSQQPAASSHPLPRHLSLLGLLMGLALITKVTAYVLLPITALVVWAVSRQSSAVSRRWSFLLIALLIALPLWLRNMAVYGAGDFLGLNWHDVVVTGQPLTVDWIQQQGWAAYWQRAWHFTFSSFWGVFGWLGIFMDSRIYTVLRLFSGVMGAGLVAGLIRLMRGDVVLSRFQGWGLSVLVLLALSVLASYVWYNLTYVQHQGRYLFPGLLAIATFAAIGWREALRPWASLAIGGLAAAAAVVLVGLGLVNGNLDKWSVLLTGLVAAFLLVQPLLAGRWLPAPLARMLSPRRHKDTKAQRQTRLSSCLCVLVVNKLRPLAWALPALLLFLLDMAIPFVYILPQVG